MFFTSSYIISYSLLNASYEIVDNYQVNLIANERIVAAHIKKRRHKLCFCIESDLMTSTI